MNQFIASVRRQAFQAFGLVVLAVLGGFLCPQAFAQQVIVTDSVGAAGDPFNAPSDVAIDKAGNLFVSDTGSSRVRRIDGQSGSVTTVAGTGVSGYSGAGGPATQAQLGCPAQMVFDSSGNLYISDACDHVVWKLSAGQGGLITGASAPVPETITNYAGDGTVAGCNYIQSVVVANQAAIDGPASLGIDASDNLFISSQGTCTGFILRVDHAAGTMAPTNYNYDANTDWMAFDPSGNLIFCDPIAGFGIVRPAAGQTLLTGNETQDRINFSIPESVDPVFDSAGSFYVGGALYAGAPPIPGEYSKVVPGPGGYGPSMSRSLIAGGTTAGYSGDGGDPLAATFNNPLGIALNAADNLFIADTANNVIRAVLNGAPTPTGTGIVVTPFDPSGVATTSGLTVSFSNVTTAGVTAVVVKPTGPAIPAGFQLSASAPVYFDIVTTAQYSGPITVCLPPQLATPGALLLHFIGNGLDFNETVGPGPGVCVIVNSLSPFALVQPVQQNQAAAITSATSTAFTSGAAGSFTVTATGTPAPTLAESGALPSGISFNAATGVLSGTSTSAGSYSITFTAHNGIGVDASQSFTMTVAQAPAITSSASASFTVGTSGSFTVTSSGFPTPALSAVGTLPGGVSFVDNLNGTATLSGTPATSGSFPISLVASNGMGGNAMQPFTLTVAPASTNGPIVRLTPSSVDFGSVRRYHLAIAKVTLQNTGGGALAISNTSLVFGPNTTWSDMSYLSLCGSSLAPGKSCAIYVFYFAKTLGTKTATLVIKDNAASSPQQVTLIGTVVAP